LALTVFAISQGPRTTEPKEYDKYDPADPVNKDGIDITTSVSTVQHGFFTWENTADNGGGQLTAVRVSMAYDTDNYTVSPMPGETISMYFITIASLPTNWIFWDPYIGVEDGSQTSLSAGAITGIVIACLVVVLGITGIIYYRRRKRVPYEVV